MATRTYYGKLDCFSNVANKSLLVNETYKGCMDFLSYVSASNEVELVSWNSGSSASAATFENRTYSDGSFPFGNGAFSLWKFKANSRRNWDWYLYLQNAADPTTTAAATTQYSWVLPLSCSGAPGDGLINFKGTPDPIRGIIMQAAVCVSGTTSFNPWNGSLAMGNANASIGAGNGGIRWISGSNDRNLYVLPRSNDLGGTHVSQKANAITMVMTTDSSARYHFMYDGDALQVLYDGGANSTYAFSHVGAFNVRTSLTSSGICGSDYGFLMYAQTPYTNGDPSAYYPANTIIYNLKFGYTAGDGGNSSGVSPSLQAEGGIVCPVKQAVSGSKGMIMNILDGWNAAAYQPNTLNSKYDEFPILVGANESPFVGFLGNLNTGLVRAMRDVQVHDTTADFSRAVFASTTTATNLSISTAWTGSNPPGISTDRTGSQFTWTTDYR